MEKRLYLGVRKNASAPVGKSVLVAIINETEDKLRVRLLEDCIARNFMGFVEVKNTETIAPEGEEFEVPNDFYGETLREYINSADEDDALCVPMKDHSGKNGYVGEFTYRRPPLTEQAIPQLELLEPIRKSKAKYTA